MIFRCGWVYSALPPGKASREARDLVSGQQPEKIKSVLSFDSYSVCSSSINTNLSNLFDFQEIKEHVGPEGSVSEKALSKLKYLQVS